MAPSRRGSSAPGSSTIDGRARLGADRQPIRMIGVHQPAVVPEAVSGEQGREAVGELPHRRPIADRPHAGDRVQRLQPAEEATLLRLEVGRGARALVQVAVMTDLVARVADRAHHLRPALGGVAGHEEGGPDPLPIEHAQEPRHPGPRPVRLVAT